MLFQIDYSVFQASRRDALTAFGTFTQEQLESLLDDHDVELIAVGTAWVKEPEQ